MNKMWAQSRATCPTGGKAIEKEYGEKRANRQVMVILQHTKSLDLTESKLNNYLNSIPREDLLLTQGEASEGRDILKLPMAAGTMLKPESLSWTEWTGNVCPSCSLVVILRMPLSWVPGLASLSVAVSLPHLPTPPYP